MPDHGGSRTALAKAVLQRPGLVPLAVAAAGVAAVTAVYSQWIRQANTTTVAMSYLVVVLFVATSSPLWVAATTSVAAALAFSFYFLPPLGSLTIASPENGAAFCAFLVVSLVASHLSSLARERNREAVSRRDELGRLFDLSRDVLLLTDGADAIATLAARIRERFHLDHVALCLPAESGFHRYDAGDRDLALGLDGAALQRALRETEQGVMPPDSAVFRPVALRRGTRAMGLMATAGRPIEPGTRDTLASLVALAIERVQFLEERKQAEIAKRSAELKAALLASLAHDLRTPLTAIRVAAENLQATWLSEAQHAEQSDIVLAEVGRLTRLFQNVHEMARIDAGAIAPDCRWIHPPEITEAARSQVEHSLREHRLELLDRSHDHVVRLDPRLTSAALAHLLENAAQYSPPRSTITVRHELTDDGLLITVQDEGMGIAPGEATRLFERFYRGEEAGRHRSGTGMGLAITRGLLAAERGRVWAENRAEGGAQFSMLVPAEARLAMAVI